MTNKLYNNKVELKFDEATHTYTVDGKVVFGVTSIVGVLDKPALIYWGINKAIEFIQAAIKPGFVADEINLPPILEGAKTAHRKLSREAADIGTAVHKYLEDYLKAGIAKETLPPLPVNPLIRKAVIAFLDWSKENNVKFIASERKIYSKKHEYAGTLDALAYVGDKLCVIDFKTSNGIYDDYWLQCAAYAEAVEEEDGDKVSDCYILRIPKDGSEFAYEKMSDFGDNYREVCFKSFIGCLENYKRKMWLKGKEVEERKVKLNKIMEEK